MLKISGRSLILFTVISQTVSCSRGSAPVFPIGLAPVMDNTAQYPSKTELEEYPEQLNIVTGTEGLPWVHARGYVHASIERVWEALREAEVMVDRRNVDEWTVEHDIDEAFAFSFRIHNVVHDVVDVEFDLEWRQDVIEGSLELPQIVASRSSLSEPTLFLTTVEASTTIIGIDEGISAIEIVQVVDAISTDELVLRTATEDWFADVTAWVAIEELAGF